MTRKIPRYAIPIFITLLIIVILNSLITVTIFGYIRERQAWRYCHSISLPDVHGMLFSKDYYCVGIRDGNTVVILIPDSVLRKE